MLSPGARVSLNPQPLPPGDIANNSALFWGEDAAGHEGLYAVFGIPPGPNPGPLVPVVQQGMTAPGGGVTFVSFNPGARVSLNPQPDRKSVV